MKPTDPLPPVPAESDRGVGDTAPLASLEALLAARPGPAARTPTADSSSLEVVQARAMRPLPPCADLDAELLLVHAGSGESTLALAWMRNVLDGARMHSVRFQENVAEQVLLRLPNIVFVHFDPTTLELASRLAAQLRTSHPHLPLVAVGRVRHAPCTLAALRCGVQDFLDLDGGVAAARQTVLDLIRRTPEPPVAESGQAPLTAVLSPRAGLGSSLLASHLAWYVQQRLAAHHGAALASPLMEEAASEVAEDALQTLLIDLGSPSGDCSTYLDTHGEFDFIEAVHNLRRFDRRLAASGLARHDSGLRLLGLARQASELREVSYADVDMLVLRLRQFFQHVVADLGAVQHTSLGVRVALRASEIWLVCDQSVASVVASANLLAQLVEQKVERDRIQLIVSRHDGRLELSASQIAQQLRLPLLAVIPERRLELTTAVNQGQLLPATLRRDPYAQAIVQLTSQALRGHGPVSSRAEPGSSGWGRLFQRIRSQ